LGVKCLKVGLIGCGAISGTYVKNLYRLAGVELVAVADLEMGRAVAKAEEAAGVARGVGREGPRAVSIDELLADGEVELVLNLTVPKAHVAVATAALEAGKHTYSEKPLAIRVSEAEALLALAKAKGLRVGCAPDTFLGAGIQTARGVLDAGVIGEPVAATAFMLCPGHESWHPDPEFYYQVGGGPMLDMGPYYVTALVALLGPVARVAGFARATHGERVIGSEKKRGAVIPVETPTHFATSLAFAGGPLGTMVMSFDCYAGALPRIEIYGTKGVLSVPDPNTFGEGGGEVKVKVGRGQWEVVPWSHGYAGEWRGLGVAEMAWAIGEGRGHRASGELAGHVLEVMAAAIETGETGRAVEVRSRVERPAGMLPGGATDEHR
jgi:predicted dehydrogenase